MKSGTLLSQVANRTKPHKVKSTDTHCIRATNHDKHLSWGNTTRRKILPDLRLGNVFQLPSRRISRRWTRSGTSNYVIFFGAFSAQTNLFRSEMKIKKMYLKSNTRQENFRTFEEPAKKTFLCGIAVLPVKSLCVLSR